MPAFFIKYGGATCSGVVIGGTQVVGLHFGHFFQQFFPAQPFCDGLQAAESQVSCQRRVENFKAGMGYPFRVFPLNLILEFQDKLKASAAFG